MPGGFSLGAYFCRCPTMGACRRRAASWRGWQSATRGGALGAHRFRLSAACPHTTKRPRSRERKPATAGSGGRSTPPLVAAPWMQALTSAVARQRVPVFGGVAEWRSKAQRGPKNGPKTGQNLYLIHKGYLAAARAPSILEKRKEYQGLSLRFRPQLAVDAVQWQTAAIVPAFRKAKRPGSYQLRGRFWHPT
jgi:hypothetical protein